MTRRLVDEKGASVVNETRRLVDEQGALVVVK